MIRHGYYTRQVSSGELMKILQHLPAKLTIDAVPGLHFERCSGS